MVSAWPWSNACPGVLGYYTVEVKARVGSGTVMRVHLPATALII
ncbi:hypothetical protein AAW51_0432 [Caldimonas brevitalea]|uniref:Uncharacterized protein n=1 Tax=Caldimonas brevitalea TaxID=413882 RepID=A0A0G3BGL2_9BURK|nr:hypothetical protein AAW51_0432 [Caldimonas brevitalea]